MLGNKEWQLTHAIEKGDLKEVERLVKAGANIHAKENLALVLASIYGHLEVVKYLVEQGADIHAENNLALRWAGCEKCTEIVEYLTYCKSLYYKMKVRRDCEKV